MATDVRNSLHHRRKIHQIARAKWGCRFSVRLGKPHAADQYRGHKERECIQNESRVPAQERGHDTSNRRSNHQVD
jgi:hypothetical protein